jgi:phosphotransferase system enzyme I (PtsP)
MSKRPSIVPTVHARGDRRLDAVLDFLAFAAKPMPLVTLLDEGPRRIARVFEADVCSLYLLEGDGTTLVMRGNVGFDHKALGQVRLSVGEGITGKAVEYLLPISAETAAQHTAYKHFDELAEDRFPVFLAVPLRGKAGALGALVVQRRETPYESRDVELLAALAALMGAGIRHAELLDAERDKQPRRAGGGTRKVTLTGRPVVMGRALGSIAALRRPAPRPGNHVPSSEVGAQDVRALKAAFETAHKQVRSLTARAVAANLAQEAAFLGTYSQILGDGRFRERAIELAQTGAGLSHALGTVAREATRNAVSFTKDTFLEERMKDLEDLCDALTMLGSADKRAVLPSKAILVGDGVTVFDLLVTARAEPVAIALTDRATGPRTKVLLRLLGVPALVDVAGLFRWATDGDIALLDGDHGLLVINPSKSEIAALRESRRNEAAAHEP